MEKLSYFPLAAAPDTAQHLLSSVRGHSSGPQGETGQPPLVKTEPCLCLCFCPLSWVEGTGRVGGVARVGTASLKQSGKPLAEVWYHGCGDQGEWLVARLSG